MDAISIQNLVVEYRQTFKKPFRAVDDLSLSVATGEVVGFVGINGAGKTTTIKTLLGFQPKTSGFATIFGHDAGNKESNKRIGFLPETALYSPYLTPIETLTLYGELHGLQGKSLQTKVIELLERLSIQDKARTLNRNLSKGMLQRVGIAQALLSDPELLILDEVSSGLDPIGRRDLRNIIEEERRKGVTVFFSSHSLSEVEMLCDRILVMHKGKLIAEQSASDISGKVASLEDYFVTLVETGRDLTNEQNQVAA